MSALISREELYGLVWAEPMTKVSERFSVSGSYLARICTILNVPRPERGHWAKLAVGKASPQPPLPEARPGDPVEWSASGELKLPPKPVAPPRSRKATIRIAHDEVHGLVRGARTHFENGRPAEDDGYLKPYKRLLLDLNASKPCLEKALALANALFNAFESAGHRVMLASQDAQLRRAALEEREAPPAKQEYHRYSGLWSPQRPTVVYIGTVAIGLAIVEMSERVLVRYVGGKYIRESGYIPPRRGYASDYTFTTTKDIPSGRLRILAYSPYGRVAWTEAWHETTKATLDASIATIVRSVERMAPQLVERLEEADRQAEIAHQKWLADMERYERAEDRKRIEASVRESREQLEQVIHRWSNVMATERFLAGIEETATSLQPAERAVVLDRLILARRFLGTQDPLDFFRAWKTPNERYTPKYGNKVTDNASEEVGSGVSRP